MWGQTQPGCRHRGGCGRFSELAQDRLRVPRPRVRPELGHVPRERAQRSRSHRGTDQQVLSQPGATVQRCERRQRHRDDCPRAERLISASIGS